MEEELIQVNMKGSEANLAFPMSFAMRSILLLVLGVPIPIIILIGLFSHF